MAYKFFIVATLIVLSVSVTIPPPTITADIMQQLLTVLDTYFFTNTTTPISPVTNRKVYRLAFHDCMGGCDGSIASTNADNNGLAQTVGILDAAYSNARRSPNRTLIQTYLSRADFFVLV